MKRNRKGFTLVELVIVIAVIGILAAVLIPTFAGVIKDSRDRAAELEVRNAIEAYLTTSDEGGNYQTLDNPNGYAIHYNDGRSTGNYYYTYINGRFTEVDETSYTGNANAEETIGELKIKIIT